MLPRSDWLLVSPALVDRNIKQLTQQQEAPERLGLSNIRPQFCLCLPQCLDTRRFIHAFSGH